MEQQRTSTRVGARRRTGEGDMDAGLTASTGASTAGSIPAGGATNTSGNGAQQGGIVNKAKERVAAQLSTQKGRATDGLDTITQAVRHTTEQLRAEDHGAVAEYIDKAAEQLERLSHRLRDEDVNELLHDARELARRQPAVFIGGSFALGLLAARFIKSSQPDGGDRGYSERGRGLDRYDTGAY